LSVRRVVLGELVHRRGRTLALVLGILVATTSFVVLTGTSDSQRLEVRGTVAASFRSSYDVLVRPRGSRSALERRTRQVQPNYLSGLFGGIRRGQWETIRRLPGIEVAAPIANVGYLLPSARLRVPVARAALGRERTLLRARLTWRAERGLTGVPDAARYAYVTPNRLAPEPPDSPEVDSYERYALREHIPGRRTPAPVCFNAFDAVEIAIDGPYSSSFRSELGCFSRRSGTGRIGYGRFERVPPSVELQWPFPLLLSAIDPGEEARLTGIEASVTDGRYLRADDAARLGDPERAGDGRTIRRRFLPVLVAERTFVDERIEIAVERLPDRSALGMTLRHIAPGETTRILRYLRRQPRGPVVDRITVPAERAYAQLLRELRHPTFDQYAGAFWTVGPTAYTRRGDRLVAVTRRGDQVVWQNNPDASVLDWTYAPATSRDVWFRSVRGHRAQDDPATPAAAAPPYLIRVGSFDPRRLAGFGTQGANPLPTFEPPALAAHDAATAARLGGAPLLPSGNLGGYSAQPATLLTTLTAARAFSAELYPTLRGRAPISAIRVRVAGVRGADAVSRERIRQAAERIVAATGLEVDITAGASGAPTVVELPGGDFGRPRLTLREPWVRKGVATQVLNAIDRKSVVLFALILVVCGLFVANATSAAVRARRSELGVLASLGWTTGRLFAVVLAEVAVIGLVAGLAGALLALPLAALVGVEGSPARAAAAVPAATALAVMAGLVPASRAARADPIAAVRPAVLETHRAWRPRSLAALAVINILRTPGRTALGALSLAIGVCALTLLLAATLAFHDTLVGTLLGDAVAVNVRAGDYVAVIATIVLGVAAVTDVLFLNLRERSTEFATLTATGWDDHALGRLLAFEGLSIGALGAITGAVVGLVGAALFAGTLPVSLLLTTATAAFAGIALATLAGLAPAAWLRRTPTVPILAGE
jgi:putative ABC transport system permease protein